MDTGEWYYLTVDNNTYYNITIHGINENGIPKDSVTISQDKAGKLTNYLWGFGWQPLVPSPSPIPLLPPDNTSWVATR